MPENINENLDIISKTISEERTFFRYSLIIEYLGTSFAGSQVQSNVKTVQSELERAVSILTKKKTKVIFSGRTDSGVHAKCQVVHFDTDIQVDERKFINSLNGLLPDEISAKKINPASNNFHSLKSAKFRWYRYLINNNQSRNIWIKDISYHLRESLNVDEMQVALNCISGKHDFTSFRNIHSDNPARECEVFFAKCRKSSGIIYIDLIANRFLYNMVRILVGTLIEIGRGLHPAEHIVDVIRAKDRNFAGPTADPKGLTLMHVGYDEKLNVNKLEANINEQNILCKAS